MRAFFGDITYSIRMFAKNPGFTITAVVVAAIGIGATTGIFSIVNTLLLRPLGIAEPDTLVVLTTESPDHTGDGDASSPAKFAFWRSEATLLQDVSAVLTGAMNYTGGGIAEQWHSAQLSADIFRCIGIRVIRGRAFSQEEDRPEGPLVVLISEDLWQRRFASDPQILGRSISLNGKPYTVIGIAAENTVLRLSGAAPDVLVPFQVDTAGNDRGDFFNVLARVKKGVQPKQAKAQLRLLSHAYRAKFPGDIGPNDTFAIKPIREDIVGDTRPLLRILLAAVSLVLLIACSNVANLLLARAAGRRREIAIRTAVGATRGRLMRQLLTESLMLSFAGGTLGLGLGHSAIRALLAVNTAGLPMVGKAGDAVIIDWRVTLFGLTASLMTGIIFGLLPAIHGSRADINTMLKDGAWGGFGRNRIHASLVVTEVGLAVVLVIGAALLIRSFVELYRVEPGFDARNVVSLNILMTGPKFARSATVASVVQNGVEQIRAIPGVISAGATCCLPITQGTYDLNFDIIGRATATSTNTIVGWSPVSPGFFEVFRIPLKRGRTFTDRDDQRSPAVAIISETMASQYWKDRDPVGQQIVIGRDSGLKSFQAEPVRQIVGIAGDIRSEGLDLKPRPIVYVPQAQLSDILNARFLQLLPMAWVVRTKRDPQALTPSIEKRLREATGLPVTDVSTMEHDLWVQTSRQRFNALLMSVFGGAALLLAAVGIYGLMSCTVEQRRHEIGIRMALGAESQRVQRMVVWEGMRLAGAGMMAGIGVALGVARVTESLLYGTSARDPLVFVAACVVLALVAFVSVWAPARRAKRVDPAEVLRCQ